MQWVEQHGLRILNRLGPPVLPADSWTCEQSLDGNKTQIDFLVADLRLQFVRAWNDFTIATGLDHRCVHAVVKVKVRKAKQGKHLRKTLKYWTPKLDAASEPHKFHSSLENFARANPRATMDSLENALFQAGTRHGHCQVERTKFQASATLKSMRLRRRHSSDITERKQLTFAIRRLHRSELRIRKNQKIQTWIEHPTTWRLCRTLPQKTVGKKQSEPPPPSQFAEELEALFCGPGVSPTKPNHLFNNLNPLGQWKNCKRRSVASSVTSELMSVDWWLNCYTMPHYVCYTQFWTFSTGFWRTPNIHILGARCFSQCCRRKQRPQ